MTPSATHSDRADRADRVATLLTEVRRRGIRIWNVGSEVHHAGPEGVLDVDLRDCLVDAKADLLDLLLAEHATEERGHPLTRTQQRFQVIRGGGTNPGDHIRLIHRLRGPVDLAALESAFLELVIQQPSLRTSFIAHEGDLVQRVVAPWRFRIKRRSMIDATSDELNAESQRFIGESFDLASGNLLRAMAIELGDDSHLLVIVGHHLVLDGWSTSVLLEELGRLYAIAADERFRERESESARFGDHARAMLDWERSERCREQIGRWQAEIAPGTTASVLPTDEDRGRDRLVEFDAVRGVLEGRLVSRLGEHARKWRTGSLQILQAVLSCLVARAAGQHLAITGLALANRTRPEHERMIGNFANESIVRIEVDPGDDFTSVLARVDEAVRRSTERIDTAFEQVVEAVGLQRIGRRRLAVPIFLSFQDRRRGGRLAFTDVSVELVPDHHLNTFQEIGLRVIEEADSMQIRIEYDRTLYTPQRIESFLANLVAMLECILEDPRTSLADLPFDASLAEGITVVSGTPRSGSQEHVEPASMIETRLAELWTDLLGVHPVGRFDDFFDLGGSSLLAVRLIDRVHEIFGTSLGLDALVSSPTLHELAGRIERSGRRLRIERSVRLGSRDDLPKLFCLPGIGGLAAFTFRDIARHLEDEATLMGLQMKGIDGQHEPDHSIEAVASTMLAEILAIQECGPFRLCGYSYGGTLAIEIAHQLRRSGHEIANLVLIDTYPPGFVTAQRRILRKMKRVADEMRSNRGDLLRDEFDPVVPEDDPTIARLAEAGGLGASIRRTIDATRDAAGRHRMRPCPEDVDVVRSIGASGHTSGQHRFERLWARFIEGDLRMHDIPWPHLELVRSGSGEVAAVIRGALDRNRSASP